MDYVLAVPAALILLISLINFVTIRTPWNWSAIDEEISVIIPMRNEAENIPELIENLRGQLYGHRWRRIASRVDRQDVGVATVIKGI
jgi:cellulose synthase/poly-beta-1,6-N-acetylglucosamine synthase-like glycosyltransferase